MLIFLALFSSILYLSLATILLHVVLRREGAYIIEEDIQSVVDVGDARLQVRRVHVTRPNDFLSPWSSKTQERASQDPVESPTLTTAAVMPQAQMPYWLRGVEFNGIVIDHQALEVLSTKLSSGKDLMLIGRTPIDKRFLSGAIKTAGLSSVDLQLRPVSEYRASEGLLGEILANFVPGTGRPVPVIITARDWNTGEHCDFVVCRVRVDYKHTLSDLGRMGLRPSAWLMPLLTILISLALLYWAGVILCVRFGRRLVDSIDALGRAARRIAKGDLSARVSESGHDQLQELAASFNDMAYQLSSFREKKKAEAILETDLRLASEVQAYLTPTKRGALAGATVWSTSTPARHVSGDLHDLFHFDEHHIGLLCADISGKGISSALVMAHLQGLVHAHLSVSNRRGMRVSPAELASLVNRDLLDRFELSRYATFLYAEVDLRTRMLRFVNAGHCYPLILHDDGINALTEGSLPVGLFADAEYLDYEVVMPENSTLIIHTDGVTDAVNEAGVQYGDKRLRAAAKVAATLANAADVGQFLQKEINVWSEGKNFDDATFVILSLARDVQIASDSPGKPSSQDQMIPSWSE